MWILGAALIVIVLIVITCALIHHNPSASLNLRATKTEQK